MSKVLRRGRGIHTVVTSALDTLTVFEGDYDRPVTHGPGGIVELTEPFPVTIDLDHLLDP
ncbi:MAG: hypothetical protein ACYDH6_07555 [Acidimicrobiales bacterium]